MVKLLLYILLEKYIHISLEMASPGNRHCANCIGASLSFPITVNHINDVIHRRRSKAASATDKSSTHQKQKAKQVPPVMVATARVATA